MNPRKSRFTALLTVALSPLALALRAGAAPEAPAYWPTCNAPQPIALLQTLAGSSGGTRSNPVWNGQDFGVAYVDSGSNRLKFARVYADGTPASAPVTLTVRTTQNFPPSLVWNGSGYGVAWIETSAASTNYQTYFARLNPDGSMIGSELKVSFAGALETASAYNPALAWSGFGYAVVWEDFRNAATTGRDIYGTLLDGAGAIANGGASHDLVLCSASNLQADPAVAWSAGIGAFIAVWDDYRSGTKSELYDARLYPSGSVSSFGSLVSGTSNSYSPSVADTGNGLGLVWHDYRDGNWEIYFARLNAAGFKVGSDLRLTSDPAYSFYPRIVWTGGEFGVVWTDYRSGYYETWFQRVSQAGAAAGGNLQVTFSGDTENPDLAFGRYGFLLTGSYPGGPVLLQAWGCAADSTPPTCPQNLVAYNITGTTASIGWIPSVEDATDLAYYEVYRNSALQGRTSNSYYNDSGLNLSTTYNYYVRPVNAAQLVNGSCTNSLYVRTNATLTLTMNKSNPNAVLKWTDAGFNNYNLFRGTRPQVMSRTGSTPALTAQDPNALNDSVSYFYSVDNPGP